MATPVVVTDGTSAFEAAVLNKYLNVGEANKTAAKLWYCRLAYDGASWTISGDADAAGLSVEDLAWSDDDDQLEITLSGFTQPPVVLASAIADDDAATPRAHATAASTVVVAWYDAAGDRVTTEATSMDACLVILGV